MPSHFFAKKPESSQRSPVLGGEASLAKLKESLKIKKTSPVKEEKKDTSVFQGRRQYATAEQRRGWLRRHAPEVWKITKGRVTSAKIPEYDKKLSNPKKWGPFIEKYKHEPEKIRKEMKKAWWKAKTYKEKWEIKQDMTVEDKMYGLEKK
jgi:hypothetical protein